MKDTTNSVYLNELDLQNGAAYDHSSCWSHPLWQSSLSIRHLKHPTHWHDVQCGKTPRTPRVSLGTKHPGTPGKFVTTEPTGSWGRRITILSIDGGGVRGVIPSTILEELEACLQVHSHPRFLRSLYPTSLKKSLEYGCSVGSGELEPLLYSVSQH